MTLKMREEIKYSVTEEVAWITINQPEKMNRLTFGGMTAHAPGKSIQESGMKKVRKSGLTRRKWFSSVPGVQ